MSYLFATLIALQSVAAIADSHQNHQQNNERLKIADLSSFIQVTDTRLTDSETFTDPSHLSNPSSKTNALLVNDGDKETNHNDCHHGHCHHPVQIFLSLQNKTPSLSMLMQEIFEVKQNYLSAPLSLDQRPPIV